MESRENTLLEQKWKKKFAKMSVRKREKDGNGLRSERGQSNFGQITIIITFPFRIILSGLAKSVLLFFWSLKRLSKIKSDLISQLGNCGPL